MLRQWVGDDAFFSGWRAFYVSHRYRKGGSDDLRRAFEQASGRDLSQFFDRWVYDDLIPDVTYTVARSPQAITVQFEQRTPVTEMPVVIELRMADGKVVRHQARLDHRRQDVVIPVSGPVRDIRVNPDRVALARFSPRRGPAR
jgi:aminopeptidase N